MPYFIYLSLTTFFISVLIGFFTTIAYPSKYESHEQFVQKYLQSVEEVFDLQTLEVHGIAQLEYSEKDHHFLSHFTNPLFAKEYQWYVPFQAVYGISLKNTRSFKFFNSKIYVDIPQPELLSFDLQMHKKKIISKEGWLVLQKDTKFLTFEKKIYEKQKMELLNNQEFKEKAKKEAQTKILELLKPLNLPVEFSKITFK